MAGAELKQQRSVTYNSSHSETSGAIRRSGTTDNTSLAAITKSSGGSGGGNISYNSNRNSGGGIGSGSRSVDSLGDHSCSQRTVDTSHTSGGGGGVVGGGGCCGGSGGIVGGIGESNIGTSGGSSLFSSIGGGSRSTCRAGASSNDALISQHGSHVEIVVDSTKLENNSGLGTGIGRTIRIGSSIQHQRNNENIDLIDNKNSSGGGNGGGTAESSIVELEPANEEEIVKRRRVRHKHRPLFRRLFSYIRGAFSSVHFSSSADSELEELEHLPPRYRPDSLSALCRATRFSEAEIKRIYRGFKAECPHGIIREETFKLIYASFFPQGANTGLYAHYIFNTLDQDNSGIVSFENFVQGLSVLSRGSVEEKLRWTFSLYDINGDGFITKEEMTDIVTAIFELMGRGPDTCPDEDRIKEKVDRLFEKMDSNRDGVVTVDEFLDCCRNDDAISRSISVFDTSF